MFWSSPEKGGRRSGRLQKPQQFADVANQNDHESNGDKAQAVAAQVKKQEPAGDEAKCLNQPPGAPGKDVGQELKTRSTGREEKDDPAQT